jgi:hypothetical protein
MRTVRECRVLWRRGRASGLLALLVAVGCGGDEAPTEAAATRALHQAFPAQAVRIVAHEQGAFARVERGFALADAAARPLRPTLPPTGAGAIELALADGFAVRVREVGMAGAGRVEGTAVAYARAGGTSYWAAHPTGVENWVHAKAPASGPVAEWQVEGGTLDLVGAIVRVLDAQGGWRLTVTAPEAFGAGGRSVAVKLAVAGDRLQAFVEAQPGEPVLVDPSWTATATMAYVRYGHIALGLNDGKVLIAGGYNGSAYLQTAELYNPATNTFALTGSMTSVRGLGGGVLLSDGRVLAFGGYNGSGVTNTAEIYNPSTGTWSATGSMVGSRYLPYGVRLSDNRVLAMGGFNDATTEIYNPSTGTWSAAASMNGGRYLGGVVLLNDNTVLACGGMTAIYPAAINATCQKYNSSTNTWSTTGAPVAPRAGAIFAKLADGRVLAGGGMNAAYTYLATAEVYNPTAGTWAATGSLSTARYATAFAALTDGTVLAAGGYNGTSYLATAELFNPGAGTWSATVSLSTAGLGYWSPAARLFDGSVLVSGGYNGTSYLNAAQRYIYAVCGNGVVEGGEQCDLGANNGGSAYCCSSTCQYKASGTTCRAAANECDQAETCSGSSATCPADTKKANGTACTDTVVDCYTAACSSGTCSQTYALKAAGSVCRAAAGTCDVAETCNGTSGSCPADVKLAAGTVCRASAGVCDVAETCSGSSAACPADAKVAAGTVCRAKNGACDVQETCTGSSAACPANAYAAAGSAGSPSCSPFACSGTAASCPTSCSAQNQCASGFVCSAGVCGSIGWTASPPSGSCP